MFIHTYNLQRDEDGAGEGPWHVAAFTVPASAGPKHFTNISMWCHATFGTPGFNHLTHQTRWKDEIFHGEAYFSRKEDLEWFLLRWA